MNPHFTLSPTPPTGTEAAMPHHRRQSVTNRDGEWDLPTDRNQWDPSGSGGNGWRFPFRDDEPDYNGPSTDTHPVPAYTAPPDTGAEHYPPSDTDLAHAPLPETDTQEATSRPRGMGKGAVTALGVGIAVVAAVAGFGGGWFLQQPKIDEAREDASLLESSLNDTYRKSLTFSYGWPICNLTEYGQPRESIWFDEDRNIAPNGVGCLYENGEQEISITAGLFINNNNAPSEGLGFPEEGYQWWNYVDDGVWIVVTGPDAIANKRTADEAESKLRALKDQTLSS